MRRFVLALLLSALCSGCIVSSSGIGFGSSAAGTERTRTTSTERRKFTPHLEATVARGNGSVVGLRVSRVVDLERFATDSVVHERAIITYNLGRDIAEIFSGFWLAWMAPIALVGCVAKPEDEDWAWIATSPLWVLPGVHVVTRAKDSAGSTDYGVVDVEEKPERPNGTSTEREDLREATLVWGSGSLALRADEAQGVMVVTAHDLFTRGYTTGLLRVESEGLDASLELPSYFRAALAHLWASRPGRLLVDSVPGGAPVSIDGVSKGATPLEIDGVAPGRRRVSIDFASGRRSEHVEVKPGELAVLILSETPGTGR